MFLVKANVIINENCKRDYLEVAEQTVLGIKTYVKGAIMQQFLKSEDCRNKYCWIIMLTNEKALLEYFSSPVVALYNANHEILGEDYDIEIYGELNNEVKEKLTNIGYQNKTFITEFGYNHIVEQNA